MANALTHIVGYGTAATGYGIRIYRASGDAARRRDQPAALHPAQRDDLAKRLLGRGTRPGPRRVYSSSIWLALDALGAYAATGRGNHDARSAIVRPVQEADPTAGFLVCQLDLVRRRAEEHELI